MKHITACFSNALVKICEKSYQQDKWEELILNHLGYPLREHVKLCEFAQGKLTLATDGSIWAQELKMHVPTLRDYLRGTHHCYHLKFIQVKIMTDIKLRPESSNQMD